MKLYNEMDQDEKKKYERQVSATLIELLDLISFLYSVSLRVNTSIKLCMILSKIIKFITLEGNFSFDNQHLIRKKIFDEISFVLKKYGSNESTQIETLYLLIALKELGREYRLSSNVLSRYFRIDLLKKRVDVNLNYFAIVVLLYYIEDKVRYEEIHDILTLFILNKFKNADKDNRGKNTELTLLLFDLLACPYWDMNNKKKILDVYGVEAGNHLQIIQYSEYWFSKWKDFDFGKELEAKKSQEVY